ncbi:hypothetical protein [Amycolatopsis sp. cmx-4-61]|uniref:nSTAND1 domain-containing NTPase n=1 Tax=Amycolatopsis sp. cmx-4-61 TaxID=2790937 RepID=UPI003979F5AD
MGRRERSIDPTGGPVPRFALELRKLRDEAGSPTYRELAKRSNYSMTVLAEAAGGNRFPTLAVTLAFVEACGGDLPDWEARWHSVAAELGTTESGPERTPYPGLRPFTAADEEYFFGRERLVDELRGRLLANGLVALSGASGCGKTSLVQAGLLPSLRRATPPVHPILLSPGADPCAALRAALRLPAGRPESPAAALRHLLAGRPPGTRLVLVVDQFEELYTLCGDQRERAEFVSRLLAFATEGQHRVHVLLVSRAGQPPRLAGHPALTTALAGRVVAVGPPDPRTVVVEPAAVAGAEIEPDLVDRLVTEAADEPGNLPVLACTLHELWEHRAGPQLTLSGYLAAGDIAGVITRLGDETFSLLDVHQWRLARKVFLRLVTCGDRAVVPLGELLPDEDPQAASTLVELLVKGRLLTIGERGVTVAHQAIVRDWPRLQTWLTENRLSDLERAVAGQSAAWRHRVVLVLTSVAVLLTIAFVLLVVRS